MGRRTRAARRRSGCLFDPPSTRSSCVGVQRSPTGAHGMCGYNAPCSALRRLEHGRLLESRQAQEAPQRSRLVGPPLVRPGHEQHSAASQAEQARRREGAAAPRPRKSRRVGLVSPVMRQRPGFWLGAARGATPERPDDHQKRVTTAHPAVLQARVDDRRRTSSPPQLPPHGYERRRQVLEQSAEPTSGRD